MRMPEPDAKVIADRERLAARLRGILPADNVIDDRDGMRAFDSDGLTAYNAMPLVVALPESTAQVAAVVAACAEMGVKVVPRGAGTGLFRRRPAARRRGEPRAHQTQPHPRHRLRKPLRDGAGPA